MLQNLLDAEIEDVIDGTDELTVNGARKLRKYYYLISYDPKIIFTQTCAIFHKFYLII